MKLTSLSDSVQSTYIYINSQLSSLPVLIGSMFILKARKEMNHLTKSPLASDHGNNYSWTVPSQYPAMTGYSLGASQSILLGTSVTWGGQVELTDAAISVSTEAALTFTTSPIAEATFTSPLINPSSVTTDPAFPTTSNAASTTPTSSPPTPTSTSTTIPSSGVEQKALSAGVKGGIAVGALAGIALIGGLGFLFGRRLQHQKPTPYTNGIIGAGFIPKNSFDTEMGSQESKGDDQAAKVGTRDFAGYSEMASPVAAHFGGRTDGEIGIRHELPGILRIGRRPDGDGEVEALRGREGWRLGLAELP